MVYNTGGNEMNRRKITLLLLSSLISVSLILAGHSAFGAFGNPITVGKILGEFELKVPKSKSEREYLGLEQGEFFTLSQIPSKLVLIEVFSTLCKVCFKTAPNVNKLFKFIQRDPDLAKNLKMIGVGVGDTDKKVAMWKTQMRVRFPLFSDPNRVAFKKFGGPGTPYTVLIDNRSGKVLYTHLGALDNVEKFLGELKELNKEH